MKKIAKKHTRFLILLPFLAFMGMFYFFSPQDIVNAVGVENSYMFMFLVALLWGLSFFSGVPYPAVLITLALWGVDATLLGIAAALWVVMWDSSSYVIGKKSEMVLWTESQYVLWKLFTLYDRFPKYLPALFFLYGVFVPLPNDLITLSAGVKGYSFWKTVLPLGLWNVIFCITIANFADIFSSVYL